jgi:predicted AlkP superfamily pyrophosphatase or phosphodiesterase
MVGGVAAHAARRHDPALLLLHFLCVDSFQHLYGPRSPEAYWALEYVDGLIGRFLDSLPDPGLDHTTVFVVSDHGFLPSHREIRPNVTLRKLGAQREARFVMNHGAGALYRLEGDLAGLHQLAREIATLEGVSGMWTAAEYGTLGLPTPGEHHQVADVMFEAAPGYAYGDTAEGENEHGPPKYLGTHGQRPTYGDNAAFFLAAGAGVRRDVALGAIRSRDVAPTVATVLDLRMEAVEGAVLGRMLA